MVAVGLHRGGHARGGGDGAQEHLHPPALQGIVGVDGLLRVVGVVLIAQVDLDAAQGVDLVRGDLRAVGGGIAVDGRAAGQGANAADLKGAGVIAAGAAGRPFFIVKTSRVLMTEL